MMEVTLSRHHSMRGWEAIRRGSRQAVIVIQYTFSNSKLMRQFIAGLESIESFH